MELERRSANDAGPRPLLKILAVAGAILALLGLAWITEDSRDAGAPSGSTADATHDAAGLRRTGPALAVHDEREKGAGGPADEGGDLPSSGPLPPLRGPCALHLHVVAEEDGRPIVGAHVAVEVWPDDFGERGTTNDSGVLVLRGFHPDNTRLRVWAEGFGRGPAYDFSVPRLREQDDGDYALTLKLPAAVHLTGVVRNAGTGAPIPGAVLTVTQEGGERAFATTTSGPDGHYHLEHLPRGHAVFVRIAAEDRVVRHLPLRFSADRTRDVLLTSAVTLRGTVLLPNGSPAATATVYVVEAGAPEIRFHWPWGGVTEVDDEYPVHVGRPEAQGAFSVSGLPHGTRYIVWAECEGYARSPQDLMVQPKPEQALPPVVLRLREGAELQVRLLDVAGAPLVGFGLVLYPELAWGVGQPTAVTDEQGRARFTGLEARAWRVVATRPVERARSWGATVENIVTAKERVVLSAGERRTIEIIIGGTALSGMVVDEHGEPIPGAWVEARRPLDSADAWPPSDGQTRTDDDGRFTLKRLKDGPHVLVCTAWQHAATADTQVVVPASNVRVVVPQQASLALRLTVPAGAAPPDFLELRHRYRMRSASQPTPVWIDSDATVPWNGGLVDLTRLDIGAGQIELEVSAEGFAPLRIHRAGVVPAARLDLGRLPLSLGSRLDGRVTEPDGTPIEGATVRVDGKTLPSTDIDGRFSTAHLPSANVLVSVGAKGRLPIERTIAIDGDMTAPRFVLPRGALLRGRLAGTLLNRKLSVRVTPLGTAAGEPQILEVDPRAFVFAARLRAGPWRIEALALTKQSITVVATLTFELVEGGTKEIELSGR